MLNAYKRDERSSLNLALTRRAFCRIGIQALPDGALELQSESPGEGPGDPKRSRKEDLHDPIHEIRDEIHHGRGEDQPSS